MPIAAGFLSLRAQECLGYHQAHKGSSPGIPLFKPSGAHGFGAGRGASVGEVHTLEFFLCLTLKYTSSEFSPFPPTLWPPFSILLPSLPLIFPGKGYVLSRMNVFFPILETQKSKGSFGTKAAIKSPWSCETLGHYYKCVSC